MDSKLKDPNSDTPISTIGNVTQTIPMHDLPRNRDHRPHAPALHESHLIKYFPWKLHTQVILERNIDSLPYIKQRPTLTQTEDRVWPRSHPMRSIHLPKTSTASGKVQITMYIERLLSRSVAVLADCCSDIATTDARWAVKFYASDESSVWHLKKEINAYKACEAIQGAEVPVFYGKWTICGTPEGACSAMLLEFVAPGTTISELRDGFKFLQEGEEKQRARLRLSELHSSGTRAVDRINKCGVVHLDLFGENMVVVAGGKRTGECVVIVDFDNAMVTGVDKGWAGYEHWDLFHMSFMPEYGPGRAWR